VDLWGIISFNEEHTIVVQAMDPASGQWVDISGSPRQITCTQPVGANQVSGESQILTDPSGRVQFLAGQNSLILEFLDDDLVHFELTAVGSDIDISQSMYTSPMVFKTDYPSHSLTDDGKGASRLPIKVQVDPATLCLKATDKTRQPHLVLTSLCPRSLGRFGQGISLTPESFTHAYGLGQELVTGIIQDCRSRSLGGG
jgi:hypothetical protein